jgi:D-3-phosphoglycerate dehydrogenase / 2-oxoglutarate reductase
MTSARAAEFGIQSVPSVEAMLPKVDVLTIHIPMTPETKHMIGEKELGLMKRSARVLNVARGGIIDEVALAAALTNGTIAGAAIDVFEQEPTPADNPLRAAPNCVITPHLGASTLEAQENVAIEAAQLIADFLLKGVVANAVNMAAVDRAELDALRQYVDLARRLGMLHAQLEQGPIRKVSITYKGELASKQTKLLTSAFTAGLLEYRLSAGVNLVNAVVTARERGIEVTESLNPKRGDFSGVMHTEVETDAGTQIAAGTLFGDQHKRLVQFGEYRLESYLDGTLFLFHHTDVPGLIGFVGNIFGTHEVNIAAMAVGRTGNAPGGSAIGVLNLDSPPPEEAKAAVSSHPKMGPIFVVKLPRADEFAPWMS